jgi:hypothetical protein
VVVDVTSKASVAPGEQPQIPRRGDASPRHVYAEVRPAGRFGQARATVAWRPMPADLVIANIERAGDHAAVLGVLLAVVAVGGLVYGVVRLATKTRAGRTDRDRSRDA